METQTRFDLNAAIADWQQELAAQPDLTPEVRRELETHLRDTIAELQKRGLNNEESFWLARRRTGRPQQLGEEFAKGESANGWRDRIFWVIVGVLYVNIWGTLVSYRFGMSNRVADYSRFADVYPGWVWFYLPNWAREIRTFDLLQLFFTFLRIVPILLLAIFLANRRLKFGHTVLNYVVSSRARFVWITLGAFLLVNGLSPYASPFMFTFQLPWMLSLIALAAWLIRPDRRSAPSTT